MSEWLTTGEMIDRLQEGEIAECETGERVKIYPQVNLTNFLGIKSPICWIMPDGEPLEFYMSEGNRKSKWHIIPNYVTFEEAMKAVVDGKNVKVYPIQDGKEMSPISFAHTERLSNRLEYYTLEQLIGFNWTIEN